MDHNANENKPVIEPTSIVKARMLGNAIVSIAHKRIVGCCHNSLHPGKLTRKIMEQHDCLGKNCRYFEKYPESSYWYELERREKRRAEAKSQKALKKQQKSAEADYFEELRILFQSYADEAGYAMQIVRVKGVRATIYVYYVSDYSFRDGNKFPEFVKSVYFFFPHHRLFLSHLRAQDGHFLTREEYAKIKR